MKGIQNGELMETHEAQWEKKEKRKKESERERGKKKKRSSSSSLESFSPEKRGLSEDTRQLSSNI